MCARTCVCPILIYINYKKWHIQTRTSLLQAIDARFSWIPVIDRFWRRSCFNFGTVYDVAKDNNIDIYVVDTVFFTSVHTSIYNLVTHILVFLPIFISFIMSPLRIQHSRAYRWLYARDLIAFELRQALHPGSAFIKPDQRNPWIKDQLGNALLSTILHLQLPNFVSCGRACPSHMTQNLVTVGAKL